MNEKNPPPPLIKSDIGQEIDKRYLTISEMAAKFGVTYRTLRFYQQKGLLAPKRRGRTRLYQPRDVAHMKIIMDAKGTGLALTDVRDVLRAFHEKGTEGQNQIILEKLKSQERLLAEQFHQIGQQLEETRRHLSDRLQPGK